MVCKRLHFQRHTDMCVFSVHPETEQFNINKLSSSGKMVTFSTSATETSRFLDLFKVNHH